MSDVIVGLPIEKSSKEMSVFEHDFKIPYFPLSNDYQVPYKPNREDVGYDLYAAEDKEILPKNNAIISLDLRIAIPRGFFGKIFSRSGLCLNHKITAEAGVINSGFRGIVQVLLFNHTDKTFYAKKGDRIAQIIFLEKFNVKFERVEHEGLIPKSERNINGFSSTGL